MKRNANLRKPPYSDRQMRWVEFSSRARMHVWNSGGPIHAPHKTVLQLLIEPWAGDYESWTVYRHETETRKDGKLVFKQWDYKAQKKRFRTLNLKTWRDVWNVETEVTERQFPLPARWVKELEDMIGRLSVPPITGSVKPLSRDTEYRLSFWRSRQRSEFRWHGSAPVNWTPLSWLFASLLRVFRQHGRGKALPSLKSKQQRRRRKSNGVAS